MCTRSLRKRAISSGVSEAELEATDDADDTKAAVIKLILAHELADANTARAELLAMKTSLLRKKAIAMDVSPEAIEDADDADETAGPGKNLGGGSGVVCMCTPLERGRECEPLLESALLLAA